MILRTAHRLFMEHGYRAVSTRQIADACGLTQPALYHYFKDKQGLYVTMLLEELAALHGGLERIARRGGEVGERLRQVVRYLPDDRRNMGQMFHDIDHEMDAEARRTLEQAFFASVVAPIAAIFADGLRHGVLRSPGQGGVDPVDGAFLLLSMLRYASAREHGTAGADAHRSGATRHGETIVRVLLHGLAIPGKEGRERHASGAP